MEASTRPEKTLTFEQLLELREHTDKISRFLYTQLTAHLETLRPLLAPRRLLGKYVGAKEVVPGADRAFAQLQEQYRQVCGKPFALAPELDEEALSHIDNRHELYPWEYAREAKSARETKTITIASSVRWVLTYSSGYTLSQVRQTLAGQEERRPDHLRRFVLHALVMGSVLAKYPGITQILTDLRYEVHTERLPGLGDLPLVTISSCLPSFCPADDLILAATRFSGIPAFIELIDTEALPTLTDPFKLRLEAMLH